MHCAFQEHHANGNTHFTDHAASPMLVRQQAGDSVAFPIISLPATLNNSLKPKRTVDDAPGSADVYCDRKGNDQESAMRKPQPSTSRYTNVLDPLRRRSEHDIKGI